MATFLQNTKRRTRSEMFSSSSNENQSPLLKKTKNGSKTDNDEVMAALSMTGGSKKS